MSLQLFLAKLFEILKNYSWLIAIIFYLQGTVYFSEYMRVLKIDPDYYPLNFESVMLYTMTMYIKSPFLTTTSSLLLVGLLMLLVSDGFIFAVRKAFNKIFHKLRSNPRLLEPYKPQIEPNTTQKLGFWLSMTIWAFFLLLVISILPSGLVGRYDALSLLENANTQLEIMRNENGKSEGTILMKCDNVTKYHPGPYFTLKKSTQYHSIYNGEFTITVPNSCIEYVAKKHDNNKATQESKKS